MQLWLAFTAWSFISCPAVTYIHMGIQGPYFRTGVGIYVVTRIMRWCRILLHYARIRDLERLYVPRILSSFVAQSSEMMFKFSGAFLCYPCPKPAFLIGENAILTLKWGTVTTGCLTSNLFSSKFFVLWLQWVPCSQKLGNPSQLRLKGLGGDSQMETSAA